MKRRGFWIGIESMCIEELRLAARHPMPIFCGQLAGSEPQRNAVSEIRETGAEALSPAEWHDVSLFTTIGQGLMLDLLRQRSPVEQITLALPVSQPVHGAVSTASGQPSEAILGGQAVDALIRLSRGALAVLDAQLGGGLTILLPPLPDDARPLELALDAFVEQFMVAESEQWASRGLQLSLRR
ncbi:MAG: hypothetical protein VW035_00680 [Luminiphilus sp.]